MISSFEGHLDEGKMPKCLFYVENTNGGGTYTVTLKHVCLCGCNSLGYTGFYFKESELALVYRV